MLRRMDSAELSEWIAYHGLNPFGEQRGDLRAGIIASVIANANRGKGTRSFKPSDFMPKFGDKAKKRQTGDEMMAIFKMFVQAQNAYANRGKAQ